MSCAGMTDRSAAVSIWAGTTTPACPSEGGRTETWTKGAAGSLAGCMRSEPSRVPDGEETGRGNTRRNTWFIRDQPDIDRDVAGQRVGPLCHVDLVRPLGDDASLADGDVSTSMGRQ